MLHAETLPLPSVLLLVNGYHYNNIKSNTEANETHSTHNTTIKHYQNPHLPTTTTHPPIEVLMHASINFTRLQHPQWLNHIHLQTIQVYRYSHKVTVLLYYVCVMGMWVMCGEMVE